MHNTPSQEHPRYAYQTPIDLRSPYGPMRTLCAQDISLGGLFLVTQDVWLPGSHVVLVFRNRVMFIAHARVVHVIAGTGAASRSHPAGMGLQFEDLSQGAALCLNRLVRGVSGVAPATLSVAAAVGLAWSADD